MENLILSLNVVLPLFLMIVLGYGLKVLKIWDTHTINGMNTVVFKVFLPVLLFINVYQTDIAGVFNLKLMLFAIFSVILIFLITWGIICLIDKENPKRGVLIQAIFRSNFVIFGIPIATSLCGAESTGAAALLVAVIVPLFNVLAVITLETFRGSRIHVRKILRGIVTNPLIIGSLLGLLFLAIGIKLPSAIEKTISDLSKVTTPLALVILGASFTFSSVRGNLRNLCIGLLGKLVLAPVIFLPLAIMFDLKGTSLAILLAIFGSPPAVSSFSMAKQMDGDADLAGQLVVFGSMFSVLTMFIWIFILKEGQFI
ncbi:MAG: AEC family transporter [Turicibacter sanguinis]|uniref:AEC family transporter n=1 Tax=Turicibacter sanguinis TaxID=154288 RepID=UPI0021D4FF36|nr:AEC family transporter [Turicibacter sanguinis]MCU7195585.1 AEC family transporter [Turicibacter sanguinis]